MALEKRVILKELDLDSRYWKTSIIVIYRETNQKYYRQLRYYRGNPS